MRKWQLVEKRMWLADRIVHSRLMIRCGYRIDFFEKLLAGQQGQQAEALRKERAIK